MKTARFEALKAKDAELLADRLVAHIDRSLASIAASLEVL